MQGGARAEAGTAVVPAAPPDRRLVAAYLVGVAATVAVTATSAAVLGVRPESRPPIAVPAKRLIGGLFRYDGGWYVGIATHGYSFTPGRQSNVAFFPLYPLLVRAGAALVGSAVVAGISVTVVSGCAACLLVSRWMRSNGVTGTALTIGMASLLLFPYSWFLYGTVYSDALFLAPLGMMVLVAERRGALTHDPTRGPSMVQRFAVPNRLRPSLLRPRDASILLGGCGLAAYMAFLGARFGRPLLFVEVEREWGQADGLSSLLKRPYWWEVDHLVHRSLVMTLTLQAVLLIGAAVLVPLVGRRFGWGYGVLQLALVAMAAIGTKDFMGSGRYLLALFPSFALIGERLATRPPSVAAGVLTASGLVLVVLTAGYGHGMFLS